MSGRFWSPPTVALASLFLVGNVGAAVASIFGRSVPSGFMFLYLIGFQWALAWWVLNDCRQRGISTSIDHGWFVFFAWPIALPHHVLQTRGMRGCLVLLSFAGLFVASYLVSVMVWVVLG
jgi:hypothetical protein